MPKLKVSFFQPSARHACGILSAGIVSDALIAKMRAGRIHSTIADIRPEQYNMGISCNKNAMTAFFPLGKAMPSWHK